MGARLGWVVDQVTSRRLAAIPTHSTGTEQAVRRLIRELGHHYRLNVRSLPGRPDLANQKRAWAVFVHGCYWHHHEGCSRATVPKNNRTQWLEKFAANQARDAAKERALRNFGYRVLVVWECEISDAGRLRRTLTRFFERVEDASGNRRLRNR